MEVTKDKNKSEKNRTEKHQQTNVNNEPEQQGYSWELIFIIAAFGIGFFLLLLKIIGVL